MEKMFEEAIALRDNGELEKAIRVLLNIIDIYPNDSRTSGVYSVLGGVYSDLDDYLKSSLNFRKSTELNPNSELASLGLYLSYAKLNEGEEAIEELIRYLKKFPAKLYKVTLEELLHGLTEGYMINYKDDITALAKINGVKLMDEPK
jgi:tetratricopeptide (TPR) repeat protein